MNILKLFAAVLGTFLFLVGTARAVVIDFDGIDTSGGNVNVTNQFQSDGVIFQDLFVQDAAAVSPAFFAGIGLGGCIGCGVGKFSAPNVGAFSATNASGNRQFIATFVDPVGGGSATTDFFQARFFDGNLGTNLIMVTAEDVFGNVIASLSVATPGNMAPMPGVDDVMISVAGIHRLIFETDSDGSSLDDFEFNPVVAVDLPEPGTLAIVGTGLAGLGFIRRRRAA